MQYWLMYQSFQERIQDPLIMLMMDRIGSIVERNVMLDRALLGCINECNCTHQFSKNLIGAIDFEEKHKNIHCSKILSQIQIEYVFAKKACTHRLKVPKKILVGYGKDVCLIASKALVRTCATGSSAPIGGVILHLSCVK